MTRDARPGFGWLYRLSLKRHARSHDAMLRTTTPQALRRAYVRAAWWNLVTLWASHFGALTPRENYVATRRAHIVHEQGDPHRDAERILRKQQHMDGSNA